MEEQTQILRIKVLGVGGGGSNAVNRMISMGIEGVDFAVMNTDIQALSISPVAERIQIGEKLTRGYGAGSDPENGRLAAEESALAIAECLGGYDLVFIVAGFGGGTGTGAVPVIARIAKDMNIMTIGIITKPFNFEGEKRYSKSKKGLAVLGEYIDTVIIIPNDRLLEFVDQETSLDSAFSLTDDILGNGIKSISSLLLKPGMINLEFADVKTILAEKGGTLLGYGEAEGANKEVDAIEAALKSPLIEKNGIVGARGILINFMGGKDLALKGINSAVGLISELVHKEANIIFGVSVDESLSEKVQVTLLAAGLDLSYDVEYYEEDKKIVDGKEEPEQTVINFKTSERGQFAKMDATIVNGEDFDIPTFLRRKK